MDIMKVGESIMMTGGEVTRLIQLKPRLPMKLGKVSNVDIGSLIGQPCGIMYEVDEARRVLVPYYGPTQQDVDEVNASMEIADGSGKDNRNLRDLSDSQAMTQDEIERIKTETGVKGLVDKLVQSSATFDDKTAFAQQKYIRRKKKKYVVTFVVERVTIDNLAEIWCPTRSPEYFPEPDSRWMRLRVDSYAQILALANVHAQSRVMISERTNGVLPTAVLSRMNDLGTLYQVLAPNCHATMTHATTLGLPNVKPRWRCVRLAALLDPTSPQNPAEQQSRPARVLAEGEEPPVYAKDPNWVSQWYNGEEANALFSAAPVDSLIVADDAPDLAQQVLQLLPYVALSGSVTVYTPYFELAANVFRALLDDCVCITLRDTWYREYQVLPGRTHPFVNMTHNGGFILNATKVARRSENDAKRHRAEVPLPE